MSLASLKAIGQNGLVGMKLGRSRSKLKKAVIMHINTVTTTMEAYLPSNSHKSSLD
jgi:hypothetical protein